MLTLGADHQKRTGNQQAQIPPGRLVVLFMAHLKKHRNHRYDAYILHPEQGVHRSEARQEKTKSPEQLSAAPAGNAFHTLSTSLSSPSPLLSITAGIIPDYTSSRRGETSLFTRFPADTALPGRHRNSASCCTAYWPCSASTAPAWKMDRCFRNNCRAPPD